MKENNRKPKSPTLCFIIWSNILRKQYLLGITDEQLSKILNITSRTLYNYQQDPSVITMKQLQFVLDKMDIEMESLLLA